MNLRSLIGRVKERITELMQSDSHTDTPWTKHMGSLDNKPQGTHQEIGSGESNTESTDSPLPQDEVDESPVSQSQESTDDTDDHGVVSTDTVTVDGQAIDSGDDSHEGADEAPTSTENEDAQGENFDSLDNPTSSLHDLSNDSEPQEDTPLEKDLTMTDHSLEVANNDSTIKEPEMENLSIEITGEMDSVNADVASNGAGDGEYLIGDDVPTMDTPADTVAQSDLESPVTLPNSTEEDMEDPSSLLEHDGSVDTDEIKHETQEATNETMADSPGEPTELNSVAPQDATHSQEDSSPEELKDESYDGGVVEEEDGEVADEPSAFSSEDALPSFVPLSEEMQDLPAKHNAPEELLDPNDPELNTSPSSDEADRETDAIFSDLVKSDEQGEDHFIADADEMVNALNAYNDTLNTSAFSLEDADGLNDDGSLVE